MKKALLAGLLAMAAALPAAPAHAGNLCVHVYGTAPVVGSKSIGNCEPTILPHQVVNGVCLEVFVPAYAIVCAVLVTPSF